MQKRYAIVVRRLMIHPSAINCPFDFDLRMLYLDF